MGGGDLTENVGKTVNKFFIGFFSLSTIIAGINTDLITVSKGDDYTKMVHTSVKAEVAQLAAAAAAAAVAARAASSSSSVRNGSTHSSSYSSSSYSRSSYSGGK